MKIKAPNWFSGVVMLGLCLYLIWNVVDQWRDQRIQEDWPQTVGVVTNVESYRVRSGKTGRRIVYDITYTYQVSRQSYTGLMKRVRTSYDPGTELPIKYDPDAPEQSTAKIEMRLGDTAGPLLLAAVFAVFGIRNFRPSKPEEKLRIRKL